MKTFSNHKDTKDTKRMNFLFVLFVSLWFTDSLFSVPTFVAKNRGGVAPDFCLISTNAISFYFRLDEAAAGPFVDATGQLANLTAISESPSSYAGKITNCLGFDNSKTQALQGSATMNVADITNGDATITYWAYLTNKAADQIVISKNATLTGARGYTSGYDLASDRWAFSLTGINGMSIPTTVLITSTNGGSPSVNTWYFICAQFCRASNYIAISVNDSGLDKINFPSTISPTSVSLPLKIGGRTFESAPPFLDRKFGGLADEVAKWNALKDLGEVTCLYKAGAPGKNQTYPFTL